MDKVWMVQMEWAYEGDHGVDTYLFANKTAAKEKFSKIKVDEKKNSWIADKEVERDASGNPTDDSLVIEEDNDTCFIAYPHGYESINHTIITLEEVEIQCGTQGNAAMTRRMIR